MNASVEDCEVLVSLLESVFFFSSPLAFGGGIYKWKKLYNALGVADMPLIIKMEATIKKICEAVCYENPQIRADAEVSPEFEMKSDDEKNRSVMALFAQTWERIIQEECIAYLVIIGRITAQQLC